MKDLAVCRLALLGGLFALFGCVGITGCGALLVGADDSAITHRVPPVLARICNDRDPRVDPRYPEALTVVADTSGLPAPQLLEPSDDAVFSHYPRFTMLTWEPVPGASAYQVEVDCAMCCGPGWCSENGGESTSPEAIADTRFQHVFVGAQSGRWRVWALDADCRPGIKSEWRGFRYTR